MVKKQEDTLKARPIRDVHTPRTAPVAKVPSSRMTKVSKVLGRPKVRLILIIIIVLFGVFFVRNYLHTRDELTQNDPVKLAAQISKFLELPTDETPTLATVKEANKLRSQAFFSHAQDGDKVLIYAKSGRAVLYRPGTKKIIEYMPINLGGSSK